MSPLCDSCIENCVELVKPKTYLKVNSNNFKVGTKCFDSRIKTFRCGKNEFHRSSNAFTFMN